MCICMANSEPDGYLLCCSSCRALAKAYLARETRWKQIFSGVANKKLHASPTRSTISTVEDIGFTQRKVWRNSFRVKAFEEHDICNAIKMRQLMKQTYVDTQRAVSSVDIWPTRFLSHTFKGTAEGHIYDLTLGTDCLRSEILNTALHPFILSTVTFLTPEVGMKNVYIWRMLSILITAIIIITSNSAPPSPSLEPINCISPSKAIYL